MDEIVIQTESLGRSFGTLRAVDQLTLAVPAGCIFGFLGPNGSGKTTTIRLLLGLLEPTSGEARVFGLETRRHGPEIRRRTGALLEHTGLYERLSARENLEFYSRIWNMPPPARRQRIRELLEHLGLASRQDERVGTWSRGMQQKLALARSLVHRPSLLFLDEPTTGLDPMAAAALREDLRTLAGREGVTVFLTTHNLAEAEKLCHLVAVIRGGTLLAVGPPDDLRRQNLPHHLEILTNGFAPALLESVGRLAGVAEVRGEEDRLLVHLHPEAPAAPLVRFLISQGIEVEEVRRARASLEDVFLTLMEEGS